LGKGEWELFDLAADPSERKDVAAERPDKVRELVAVWDAYVRANNVVLPSRSVFETLEDQLPPRTPDDAGYPPLVNKRQFVPPPNMTAKPKGGR
jgi:arylsulfatase